MNANRDKFSLQTESEASYVKKKGTWSEFCSTARCWVNDGVMIERSEAMSILPHPKHV